MGLGDVVSQILAKDVAAPDPVLAKRKTALMKELDADQQSKYARDGEIDHERKMNLWHEQAGEREALRIGHCAKLGVAKDTTWEQLKKIHDGE